MAEQQGTTLAYIMGLRPKSDPPSYNELLWWAAWRSYIPNVAARVSGMTIDKFFDPVMDPDMYEEIKPSQEEIDKNRAAYEEEKARRAREE